MEMGRSKQTDTHNTERPSDRAAMHSYTGGEKWREEMGTKEKNAFQLSLIFVDESHKPRRILLMGPPMPLTGHI